MASFVKIKDPILRIYASRLFDDYYVASTGAQVDIYSAKRSLHANPRVPQNVKDEAQPIHLKAERLFYTIRSFYGNETFDDGHDLIKALTAWNDEWAEAAKYFSEARRYFQRFTSIDSTLYMLRRNLTLLRIEFRFWRAALMENDDDSKKKIYADVLGKELEQLDAPYLFDVIDFIVELANPPPFRNFRKC